MARLRALLRFLPFALLAFVAFPLKARWLRHEFPGLHGIADYLINHLIELVALLAFTVAAAALERRPFGTYGLPPRLALRTRFWQGALAGIILLTLLIAGLAVAGALQLAPPAGPLLPSLGFALGYGIVFLLLGIREEFLYRGYSQVTLAEAMGFWPAAVITSAWFTATHLGPSESPIGLANVALFGLLACFTLRRTGHLWLATGFHAAWDWGQTWLYGVGDSGHPPAPGHLLGAIVPAEQPTWLTGGDVGPEGSVLAVIVLGLAGLACLAWLRRDPADDGTLALPTSSL
ncbi:MAG TPA: type II CAAX endopeptidase family protein [Gemmatimonadales bacterium]|nr:type II CAAX endopeptidase family protein [Gemmatimonadales bacterium]